MSKEHDDQPLEKKHLDKVPEEISQYINKNFDGGFLSDIHTFKDRTGKDFYNVDISHDNSLHHLKFSSNGTLVHKETEPLLELDAEDEIIDDD